MPGCFSASGRVVYKKRVCGGLMPVSVSWPRFASTKSSAPSANIPTRRKRALPQNKEAFFPAQRVKARYQPAMAQAQQFAVQLQPVIVLARGHLVPIQYRTLEGLRVGRIGDAFTCGEIAEFRKVRELRAASSDDLVAEFGVEIAEK